MNWNAKCKENTDLTTYAPKYLDKKIPLIEKKVYREKQREVVLSSVRSYNQAIPIVMNLSIGQTDPQLVIPYGGFAKIDGKAKTVQIRCN